MGQSTNDVFPTATRLALLLGHRRARRRGAALARRFDAKAAAFADVLKVGRTHLQDAVPITLGQEFGGYAACIARGADDVERAAKQLLELNLGATAVGTGLNAGDDYTRLAVAALARETGIAGRAGRQPLPRDAEHGRRAGRIRARCGGSRSSSARSPATCGCSRWGRAPVSREITLPAVQPGSSIMPGKVNPSIPEMVNQVCYQVMGCDATIAAAAEAGQLELNVMMPVIAVERAARGDDPHAGADRAVAHRPSKASRPTSARCRELLDRSTAVATALSPYIGYAATAEIAKAAVAHGPVDPRASCSSGGCSIGRAARRDACRPRR